MIASLVVGISCGGHLKHQLLPTLVIAAAWTTTKGTNSIGESVEVGKYECGVPACPDHGSNLFHRVTGSLTYLSDKSESEKTYLPRAEWSVNHFYRHKISSKRPRAR